MSEQRAEPSPGGDRRAACGIAAGFLLLYLRTRCPTVYLGDAGEIATAIASGGVVHPPGYPVFSLLGRLSLLIPLGEPAFRIGCFVALAGAAALAVLFLAARAAGCSRWASATGVILFGLSYTFWSQCVRVEVYSFHLLLVALALLFALHFRHTGKTAAAAGMGIALSLGVAHHLTIVLLGPALLLLCGPRLWAEPRRASRLAVLAACGLVGPVCWLLLMVWARAEPLQDWGRPVTLALLWSHVSGRFYHGNLGIPDPPRLFRGLGEAAGLAADSFPYLTFLLPAAGCWLLWKRQRSLAAALFTGAGVITAYNLCYRILDISSYYLPVWALAVVPLGYALDGAAGALAERSLGRGLKGTLLAASVLVLAAVLPAWRNWASCDLSRATWVRDFARLKLEHTDPGGVLLTRWDPDTFPIWYVQDVLHVRPDVAVVDTAMAGGTWRNYRKDPSLWYIHRLRKQGVEAGLPRRMDPGYLAQLGNDGYLLYLLSHPLKDRPLHITFASAAGTEDGGSGSGGSDAPREFFRWAAEHYQSVPQGLVIRLLPKTEPVDLATLLRKNRALWASTRLPDLTGMRMDQEISPDYVVNHYATMLVNYGGLYEAARQWEQARAVYRQAAAWAPRFAPAQVALRELDQHGSALSPAAAHPSAGDPPPGAGPREQ